MDEITQRYIDLISRAIIDNINRVAEKYLKDNKRKLIIFYTMKCEFCMKYLDELKKYDEQFRDKPEYISYELFDTEKEEYYQFAKALKFKGIPTTAFVNEYNRIVLLVGGVIPYDKIIETATKIYETKISDNV